MKLTNLLGVAFVLMFLVSNASAYHPTVNGQEIEIDDNGHTLNIKNNPEAQNPTYEELIDFLHEDNTNEYKYKTGTRECGWFAQRLHNKAEKAGIKAEVVVWLSTSKNEGHGFTAFKTVDEGYVYIDETSGVDRVVDIENWYHAVNIDDPEDVEVINRSGDYKTYYFE